MNGLTETLNGLHNRITLLEGPWHDAEGNLDFEIEISALRINLIPGIHRSLHNLMKGIIGDVDNSDSGDENERKKRKISHSKNSTTMSCDEMNQFKGPSNDKNGHVPHGGQGMSLFPIKG